MNYKTRDLLYTAKMNNPVSLPPPQLIPNMNSIFSSPSFYSTPNFLFDPPSRSSNQHNHRLFADDDLFPNYQTNIEIPIYHQSNNAVQHRDSAFMDDLYHPNALFPSGHSSTTSPPIVNISRRGPSIKPPKVFVSYLPPVYTVEDVTRLFSPYGTIVSIKLLPTPNESLLPLKYRCGFVQFDHDSSVQTCIAALHQFHLTLDGKRYILTVRNASDQAPVNNTNLMVKGLSMDMSERRLFDMFIQYGRVTSVRIIRDRNETEQPADEYQRRPAATNKGLAFVNYAVAHDAHQAIHHLNNVFVDGRRIQVSFAEKEYPYNVHVFDKDPGPEIAALQSGTPVPEDHAAAQHYPTPGSDSIRQDRRSDSAPSVVSVTNIPGWATENHVGGEFMAFGEIMKLKLVRGSDHTQTALIAFAHPLSAMRAVHTPTCVNDVPVVVSFAHNYHDPVDPPSNLRLMMHAPEFHPALHHQNMPVSPKHAGPISRPRTFSTASGGPWGASPTHCVPYGSAAEAAMAGNSVPPQQFNDLALGIKDLMVTPRVFSSTNHLPVVDEPATPPSHLIQDVFNLIDE